jgi:hypothetical protein
MLVSFTGKMGSGKTTAANIASHFAETYLKEEVKRIKFADTLYDIQYLIQNRLGLELEKDRRLLQLIGQWGREIDKDFWCTQFYSRYLEITEPAQVLINDDCRFNNEAELIKRLGGKIVLVVGPQRGEYVRHTDDVSENGINGKYIDFVIDNSGNAEDLMHQLKELIVDGNHFTY